jgi:hypothetical protein
MSSSISPDFIINSHHGLSKISGKFTQGKIDGFFSKKKNTVQLGPRLSEITLQTAEYGRTIPIIYGVAKLAGNIIWASDLHEHRQDHYQRSGKFSKRSLVSSQFYYSISLAIAICEGEVNEILRVWADDCLIDPRKFTYRFYPGNETQMPDPLIESIQGVFKTPAFRGLSYVVIENLPLNDFANHIPQFVFEVKRKIKSYNLQGELSLEERIKSMVIIPGSGEFVYDTQLQYKVPKNYNPKYGEFNLRKSKINQNNRENKTDSLLSLDQLQDTCPNLTWVAPVAGWFATSLEAGKCSILPGVEYKLSGTSPNEWQVAGYNREIAHLVSQDQYSNPIYGGTINDLSLIRYLDELRSRGYKIMFYPMIFVDNHDKPWRGRITGTSTEIDKFFNGVEGYNKFILHYANLVKNKVDAFLIGSEMIGLTKIRDNNNQFPAVNALLDLAKQVKKIMGDKVKISYGADWSEYHHTDDGWYNLDKLWACDYIDFVGIDAYFPLTNTINGAVDEEMIIQGWKSGEGYDYYYLDQEKTKKENLSPEYAWKNIAYWWQNQHVNPDGIVTEWKAKHKKIWFTEIGFPSVDLASNQPNVFYNLTSVESKFPIHSTGRVDFLAQRQALSASEKFWRNSEFLENMFIWTWDSRPYPYWPDLQQVWSDGDCWSRGHWVNGKLGMTKLEHVIQDLCKNAGIPLEKVRAEQLNDLVDGIVILYQERVKDVIDLLKSTYFFDTHESDGQLFFVKRNNSKIVYVDKDDLVTANQTNREDLLLIKHAQNNKAIMVHYFNKLFDYQISVESANCNNNLNGDYINLCLPVILEPQKAKTIAEISLQEMEQNSITYNFSLLPQYCTLRPNDIIYLHPNVENTPMRILNIELQEGRVSKITAVSIREEIYNHQAKIFLEKQNNLLLNKEYFDPGNTQLLILKLVELPYEVLANAVYLGVMGSDEHWRGAHVLCPDNSVLHFKHQATAGIIEYIDDDMINLLLINGDLYSKDTEELQRYANLAVIGNEVIQFANAEFLGNKRYKLSGIKREMFNSLRSDDSKFILLDNNLQKIYLGKQ